MIIGVFLLIPILLPIHMKLEFVSPHKSIESFDSIDLDDFSIFTGKNGSGKTQLLQAIKNGHVKFGSVKPEEIIYFDLSTFRTFDTKFKSGQNRISFLTTVHNNFKNKALGIRSHYQSLTEVESNNLNEILEDKNRTLLDINEKEVGNEELWKKIKKYQYVCQTFFTNKQFDDVTISIIKKSKNFIHDISDEEFQTNYVSVSSRNNLILTELGILFYDYQIAIYEEREHVRLRVNENTSTKEIEKIVQDKCNARFGGIPPWEAINNILESYSDMNHELIEPQKIGLSQFRVDPASFPVVIKVKSTNAEIIPDDLSSGESVLFALALSVFKENISSSLPKVLLLDEIDATLHPSMIKNLLCVIEKIFVERGVKVILATHSPTTIALCRDKSIFVIDNDNNSQLIQKQSPENALDKLTNGFVTIEEGLNLLKMISDKEITIVTEGTNTKYIQKAIDLFANDNKDKIDVQLGAEDNLNNTILKTLFDFFTLAEHKAKVIFVFDPDCEEYRTKLHEKNNTYFYILLKNSQNTMTDGGIETLFDDKCFVDEDLFITTNAGRMVKKTMYDRRKVRFRNNMIGKSNIENFGGFKPLFDYINTILNPIPEIVTDKI